MGESASFWGMDISGWAFDQVWGLCLPELDNKFLKNYNIYSVLHVFSFYWEKVELCKNTILDLSLPEFLCDHEKS